MNTAALDEKVRRFLAFAGQRYIASHAFDEEDPEEREFATFLESFSLLSSPEREYLRTLFTDSLDAGEFAAFAVRCASFAVQSRDVAKLRPGAMALMIDAESLDPRDLVRALAVLNDASARLGVDPFRDIVGPLLGSATESRRKLIEGFFFHPDSVQKIESMGYELITVEGLPWFRRSPI